MSTCYADPNPSFRPAMRLIAAITNASPATITTTFDHEYLSGTIVRLHIPYVCGMQEAHSMTGSITVTGATTFTIPIDTTHFDVFAIPGMPDPHDDTCAQVIPVAEDNSMLSAAVQNVLG